MPAKIRPDIINAIRLPKGIESPHKGVANFLSLSGNHPLQNYVIILQKSGYDRLITTSPARIGHHN